MVILRKLEMRTGLKLDIRYFYYIDLYGNVIRVPRPKIKGSRKLVLKTNIKKERGYIYFIDKKGDIYKGKIIKSPKDKPLRKMPRKKK